MTSFKDNAGRIWSLSLAGASLKRVRALCGVDLANVIVFEGDHPNCDLLERLASDPDPFTLRSLVRMAEAKGRYDWNQTSSLMALMVNLA